MNLTPREKDKLLVALAAIIARKRLERGVFRFPASSEAALAIDSTQLLKLLSGSEIVVRRAS